MEETIGQRINVVRKKLNLTLEKFGEKIGISKVSVRAIEKGINNPSEQTIKLICSVYNVDYAWLTQGVGEDIFISIPESNSKKRKRKEQQIGCSFLVLLFQHLIFQFCHCRINSILVIYSY